MKCFFATWAGQDKRKSEGLCPGTCGREAGRKKGISIPFRATTSMKENSVSCAAQEKNLKGKVFLGNRCFHAGHFGTGGGYNKDKGESLLRSKRSRRGSSVITGLKERRSQTDDPAPPRPITIILKKKKSKERKSGSEWSVRRGRGGVMERWRGGDFPAKSSKWRDGDDARVVYTEEEGKF